jgi:hypothetical protein
VLSAGEILTLGWRSFASGVGIMAVVFIISGPHLVAALAGYGPGSFAAAFALRAVSRSHRPELFVRIDPHAWRPNGRALYEGARG